MNPAEILAKLDLSEKERKGVHVLRCFSSFVAVSGEKVIKITDPEMSFCPLANAFYEQFKNAAGSPAAVKEAIRCVVEEKIRRFGFFTSERNILEEKIAIPYGASEIMMFALTKGAIDTAVVVCDGAGTVITNAPQVVQGIGARMHGLFITSPIDGTIKKLRETGADVPFADARIDQIGGVEEAARRGLRKIAVTVNGFAGDDLGRLVAIEKKYGVQVTVIIICTTGMTAGDLERIRGATDLIWGCASREVREVLGPGAILQLSRRIPVFVLTKKGLDFVSAYFGDQEMIRGLDRKKQYLVDTDPRGEPVRVGDFDAYLREAELPVRSHREPI